MDAFRDKIETRYESLVVVISLLESTACMKICAPRIHQHVCFAKPRQFFPHLLHILQRFARLIAVCCMQDGGPCLPCEFGTYKPSAGSATCNPCPANTYTRNKGSPMCEPCPANSQSPPNSHLVTSCACNQGYAGQVNGTCAACRPGTFKTATWSAACTPCSAGKYSDKTAQKTEAECKACMLHSSSPPGSTSASSCICDPGYAGPDCRLCPPGTWCHLGQSYNCSVFSTSPSGAWSADNCTCEPGYTPGVPGGNCTPCALNKYKDKQSNATCHDCPAPSITTRVGAESFFRCVCPPGMYGPLGGPCTVCPAGSWCVRGSMFSCAAHSWSGVGSWRKEDCRADPGYYGVNGSVILVLVCM
jgi:hypothetical protein